MTERHIQAAIASNIGLRRKNNQDSGMAENGVYLVCDGMGGGVGGQRASASAVARLRDLAAMSFRSRADIENVLAQAQHDVLAIGDELHGVSGTTVTGMISPHALTEGAEREPGMWYVINIGDSRTYHLDRDENGAWDASTISHVTKDHSKRQEAIDSGTMLPEVAEATIPRNIITQCIGDPEGIRPDFYAVEPDGRFIICSDGLHGEVDDDTIAAIAAANREPQDAVDALIAAALDAGGTDNVTVIVADITNEDDSTLLPWHASKLAEGEDLESVSDETLDALRIQTTFDHAQEH